MKTKIRSGGAVFALSAMLLAPCGSLQQASAAVDFGDSTSATLTAQAWDALGRQEFDDALTYVDKCISLYEGEAKTMQASLTAYPPTEPKEETGKYWALNDVGTCCFIKGEILRKKGDLAGAKASYGRCISEFSYGQCWDPKGWYWKPADAAKQKIVELEFNAKP